LVNISYPQENFENTQLYLKFVAKTASDLDVLEVAIPIMKK
jgi:hypothetical protein